MKKLFTYLTLLVPAVACAQSVDQLTIGRQKLHKNGMKVLGAYAAANIVYAAVAAGSTGGSTRYFHQMNALWNTVNFSLAAFALLRTEKPVTTYADALRKQQSAEKVFLFNAGLDAAYIAGGFYLQERSRRGGEHAGRNKGYGQSIVLQGSALLLFDGVMYLLHRRNGAALLQLAPNVAVAPANNGLGVQVAL